MNKNIQIEIPKEVLNSYIADELEKLVAKFRPIVAKGKRKYTKRRKKLGRPPKTV